MILSRLTRAIRAQNWFAVVLEFVIVIAGVVIGFQVTAWNAKRQDCGREGLILCRLASDFDQIEADVRQHLTDALASQRMAEAIVTAAQTGITPEALEALDIRQAITLRVAPAGSPTYSQLVTSGDMALIRSEPVRRALIDFHEQLARFQRTDTGISNFLSGPGAMMFEFQNQSSDSINALPAQVQADLHSRLASTDFYLAANSIHGMNVVNLGWKTTLVEAVERVDAVLAPETSQCAGEAEP